MGKDSFIDTAKHAIVDVNTAAFGPKAGGDVERYQDDLTQGHFKGAVKEYGKAGVHALENLAKKAMVSIGGLNIGKIAAVDVQEAISMPVKTSDNNIQKKPAADLPTRK